MTISTSQTYVDLLKSTLDCFDWSQLDPLTENLFSIWKNNDSIYICGNGGSAANSDHIANDLSYGVNPSGKAFNVESLSSNNAVISCLANDTGYRNIFAQQLKNKACENDLLIVLSGSGNSENIISALEFAKTINMKTCGILGFEGGKAKDMLDFSIHFPVMDMQISEDLQLIVGHILMKNLHQLILNSVN